MPRRSTNRGKLTVALSQDNVTHRSNLGCYPG